jgi:hypothetical protein
MGKNTKEIELMINNSTASLVDLVKKNCWNKISTNYEYIFSRWHEFNSDNFFDARVKRRIGNEKKQPKLANEIADELCKFYMDVCDLNFYIYKSLSNKTIIEIEYYPKTSLEKELLEMVKDKEPSIHCKVSIPFYLRKESDLFDVNWELGGLGYQWDAFWHRFRCRFASKGR